MDFVCKPTWFRIVMENFRGNMIKKIRENWKEVNKGDREVSSAVNFHENRYFCVNSGSSLVDIVFNFKTLSP